MKLMNNCLHVKLVDIQNTPVLPLTIYLDCYILNLFLNTKQKGDNMTSTQLRKDIKKAMDEDHFPEGFDFKNAHPKVRVRAANRVHVWWELGWIEVSKKSLLLTWSINSWEYMYFEFDENGDLFVESKENVHNDTGLFDEEYQDQWEK